MRCHGCGSTVDHYEAYSFSDHVYCEICFNDLSHECDMCGEVYPANRLYCKAINKKQVYVCQNCIEKLYICASCGDMDYQDQMVIHKTALFRRGSFEGYRTAHYCKNCAKKLADKCSECGKETLRVFPYYKVKWETRTLCPECAGRNNFFYCECEGLHKDVSECTVLIHRYNFVPKFKLLGTDSNRRIGIELEVQYPENRANLEEEVVALSNKISDFAYLVYDGSISRRSGVGGFEIVTQPMTMKYMKTNISKFDPIFELKSKGYRSFNTDDCALHVHLSKEPFARIQHYKLCRFFYDRRNRIFLKRVSRKDDDSQNNYSRFKMSIDSPGKIGKYKYQEDDKYTAINFKHKDSVEIRIFKGTLNETSFFGMVELTYILYDFTRQFPVQDMWWKTFIQFVKNSNYKNAQAYLEQIGY